MNKNPVLIALVHKGSTPKMREFAIGVIRENAPDCLEIAPGVVIVDRETAEMIQERFLALVEDAPYVQIRLASPSLGVYDSEIHKRLTALGLDSSPILIEWKK